MNEFATAPRSDAILSKLISASGYRPFIVNKGYEKKLDLLAAGKCPEPFKHTQLIEQECFTVLRQDCGKEWAELFHREWVSVQRLCTYFSLKFNYTSMTSDCSRELHGAFWLKAFAPRFLWTCISTLTGPDFTHWWKSPFQSWLVFASKNLGIPEKDLIERVLEETGVDFRTLQHWQAGDNIQRIHWPKHRKVVESLMSHRPELKPDDSIVDLLTGWLVLAVAFQTIPRKRRIDIIIGKDLQSPSDIETQRTLLKAFFEKAWHLGKELHLMFNQRPPPYEVIKDKLLELQTLIDGEVFESQYIHDFYSARLSAWHGKKTDAVRLYRLAIKGSAGGDGQDHRDMLYEALVYSHVSQHKVSFKHHWDRAYVLNLYDGPKRQPEDSETQKWIDFHKAFMPFE